MSAPEGRPVLWTAADAAAATHGRAVGDWQATGVSIDSRTVQPGDLFVAVVGPNRDGHEYVADALAKGAAAAMAHRPPPGVPADAALLAVADTTEALGRLASYARLRANARVVGVTGSVGKTGTKEALALALGAQGKAFASAGNLNNQWGVPLSLSRMPPDADFAAFELGMNHAGEIAPLSRRVKPDVAIITTVTAAHLENFPSVAAIADAKAEIFAGMGAPGAAVLNRDNEHYPTLVAHARTQGLSRIWSFGEHAEADARLLEASLHDTCSAVAADIRGRTIDYSLPVPGKHWVLNSLAVLLAVKALGADVGVAAQALSRLDPLQGRGRRTRLRLEGRGSFLLIDESYNASPAAMAAAIEVLGRAQTGEGGRRIAVLGDMLELGPAEEELHARLAEPLMAAGIDTVFACGPRMAALNAALPADRRGGYAPDSDSLAVLVGDAVRPGDVVMVKGSLGSRMARVVEALRRGAEGCEAPARAANG
jgi:UDP-N-acetylmuramoyl-tripeptide--D-alanyl-D-alanine ligase